MAVRSTELRRLLLHLRREAAIPLLGLRGRPVSTAAAADELAGKSAYEVLGVGEASSSAEIKASFHRLAKETHPDVAASAASCRFLQILAAYEILSDSQKRAHYDIYLRSQRRVVHKHPRPYHHVYPGGAGIVLARESNVVEWLKWYRFTMDDIVSKKRVATGSGYFDRLESELYTAIHAAYYGPDVESMDLLPDCFEAEERSVYETPELLHLVSGRDLFGMVSLSDSVRELSDACHERLTPSGFRTYNATPNVSTSMDKDSIPISSADTYNKEKVDSDNPPSDVYKDIELQICGKVVATATRSLKCSCINKSDVDDHIHVFLAPNESVASNLIDGQLLLGTITGLATTGEEGSCCVYDGCGIKTHVIVKHRTLMLCMFRLNTCIGIKLEMKFHLVNAAVAGLGCHLAGIGFLSLVVTCMILVAGTLRHLGEIKKGERLHHQDSGMVSMNILKRDCIQQCIWPLWLTDH